ncbi:leucine-rich repeat protein [Anaerocolumna sedimenticola]|uniref:Leucine-rich repeat protein n=1 Tax=Anaerocolumna sedimenticola TaxID=2696063 RepID=A0A6P1TGF8_9FIRM|nr:leucine-rich repeat protein [Anaerocolumna sedimenticola]QHQ59503.1 leucine-rich repeat protein [Anaerocolumna sedimenticola]
MNKLKIVSIIFLAITFQMIGILPSINVKAAEQTSNEKDFVIKDGVLTRYVGEGGDVVVPDGVEAIGQNAFNRSYIMNKTITSVILPDSVTAIGNLSFYSCDNLESVKMSDSVKSIGREAFFGCTNLTEISSLEGVTTIGSHAFALTPWLDRRSEENPFVIINGNLINGKNCKGDVVIPDTVHTIVGNAFSFNKKITSVSIPDSVKSIGAAAFVDCSNLITVKMSNSVESIGLGAFENCIRLKNIRLSNSLKQIEEMAFNNCKKLTNITIPDSLSKIDPYAFVNCVSLKYVTISNKVTSVESYGNKAFFNCPNLTFYGQDKSYIQSYANKNKIPFKKITIAATNKILAVGETYRLNLNSMAKCTWKSSNNSIASVNYYGQITAKKKGKATITATLYGKNYQCVITVK